MTVIPHNSHMSFYFQLHRVTSDLVLACMADHAPAQRMGQLVSLCGVCLAFTQCLVIAIPVICIKLMAWKTIGITFSFKRNLVANEFIATLDGNKCHCNWILYLTATLTTMTQSAPMSQGHLD